ncbi:MAG TPA: M23 family metallopeptidase [Rhizomicrobium sp.]|nr:M23 family metallopeptidase [Rhizomicrobium sp.]
MRKTGNDKALRGLLTVCVLCVPVVLAGCMTRPHTQLDWPGYRTSYSQTSSNRHHGGYATRHKTRGNIARARHNTITPQPRPRYAANVRPKPRRVATAKPRPRVTPASYHPRPGEHAAFRWPVNGKIISQFGSGNDGQRNDGINIAATMGEPIRAAASGKVTYAGDELKSYGNLVLLKHDNGYVSAYAHAEKIVVGRGDYVSKGQVIGYAGDTGDVRVPQVHFEIRRGVRPVDPRPLLVASS